VTHKVASHLRCTLFQNNKNGTKKNGSQANLLVHCKKKNGRFKKTHIRTMKLIKSLLFADDTALLANGSNIEALTDFVNDEFHKVVYYF